MVKTQSLNFIQKLQFSDVAAAEQMMLTFLQKNHDPKIVKVELFPKPESLNSVNGYLTYSNQKKFFFKSHTEESEKLDEYYNATLLAEAGYPVVASDRVNTEPGQQIAIYEIISYPTLFDLIKQEEDMDPHSLASRLSKRLITAQKNLDQETLRIYQDSLHEISALEHAKAPVHQLFSHRLEKGGRISNFYHGKTLHLTKGSIPFEQLETKRWVINGVEYTESLKSLIEQSRLTLAPRGGASIIGHGDAHNGNVFFDAAKDKLYLFDPAFAGRHHPLLDIAKPLFHNAFARWMYYPLECNKEFQLEWRLNDDTVLVEHDYQLSEIRLQMLSSKVEFVLKPVLTLLKAKNMLAYDWRAFLRSALFCCPFLTVNLLSDYVPNGTLAERYPQPIKLLGLSMAIELAATPACGKNRLSEIVRTIFD